MFCSFYFISIVQFLFFAPLLKLPKPTAPSGKGIANYELQMIHYYRYRKEIFINYT